jgi:hypothetical protein
MKTNISEAIFILFVISFANSANLKQSYSNTCSNISFSGFTLSGDCEQYNRQKVRTSIDIQRCLKLDEDKWIVKGKGSLQGCNCSFSGEHLSCDCGNGKTGAKLTDHISNYNGQFGCIWVYERLR